MLFDDFRITHTGSPVVAGADYYPFGLTMTDREILDEAYRYGYQGQYSEEDKTTGWNEFELRMYDARFGRWTSIDPYGQFASPYVGMGNGPHMSIDPDGGLSFNIQASFLWAGVGAVAGGLVGKATGDEDLKWWVLAGSGAGFLTGGLGSNLAGLKGIAGDGLRFLSKRGLAATNGIVQEVLEYEQSQDQLDKMARENIPNEIQGDLLQKAKNGGKTTWILDKDELHTGDDGNGGFTAAYTESADEKNPNADITVFVHPSVLKAVKLERYIIIGHEWIHVTHYRTIYKDWRQTFTRLGAKNISEYNAWKWSYHQDPTNSLLLNPQQRMNSFLDVLPPRYKFPAANDYFH